MSKPTNEFCRWWQKHKHSGFFEDKGGHSHWTITPRVAWHIDRYRREFSEAGGEPYCNEFLSVEAPNLISEYDGSIQAKAAAQLAEFLESRKTAVLAPDAKAGLDPQSNMAQECV